MKLMSTDETPPDDTTDRWTLLRDAGVLQIKLIVDGLRDLLLVPASLIAAVVSLLSSRDGRASPAFYELLSLGRRSERAINLFGACDNAPESVKRKEAVRDLSVDDLVRRVETFVVDEYRQGGVTAQAKDRIDKALDTLQETLKERGTSRKTLQDP